MDYRGRVNVDLNSAWTVAVVEAETVKVAARARAYAPVKTGELQGTISSHVERHSGAQRDRAVGVVSAGTDHDVANEFGTSRQRGSFFLRRALIG